MRITSKFKVKQFRQISIWNIWEFPKINKHVKNQKYLYGNKKGPNVGIPPSS